MVLIPSESPARPCDRSSGLPSFLLDRTEVTVSAYRACVDSGRCTPADVDDPAQRSGTCNWSRSGADLDPINCVSWEDAAAFCAFLGKRLPSSLEWERAARGSDGRPFPWGDASPSCHLAIIEDEAGLGCGRNATWPVGSRPEGASPFGALDMVGNVWEWTDESRGDNMREFRGGSWAYDADFTTADAHPRFAKHVFTDNIGFRCARDICR